MLHIENKKTIKSLIILLSCLFITFTAFIPIASANFWPDNKVEFVSRVENIDGTTTWTYNVWLNGPLCHWVIAWCGGANSIKAASHSYTYGLDSGGSFDSNLWGIRFEFPSSQKGKGPVTYWFKLDKNYTMGNVDAAIVRDYEWKTNAVLYDTVVGPIFTYALKLDLVPVDPPPGGLPAGYLPWRMVANASTDYGLVTRVDFEWHGPFGEAETPGRTRLNMTDYDNNGSDGFISYYPSKTGYIHEDDLGKWYVIAIFTGGRHPGEAEATIDPTSKVPWFTSLPIILAVTIGTVALFRRKKILKFSF